MMAELWGSVVVSVLFWGLANRIMSVTEARRYYPLFGLGANVALIFSGQCVRPQPAVSTAHARACVCSVNGTQEAAVDLPTAVSPRFAVGYATAHERMHRHT